MTRELSVRCGMSRRTRGRSAGIQSQRTIHDILKNLNFMN